MSWEYPKELEILYRVLTIRDENGFGWPADMNQFRIQIRKSALFQRLLGGKEPLPEAPPLAYSYPWYDLIDDGYGSPGEVWEPQHNLFDYPTVVVDQCVWKLIEKLGENDWIITYQINREPSEISRLKEWVPVFSETKWHVYTIGSRWPQMKEHSASNLLWKIEKIT